MVNATPPLLHEYVKSVPVAVTLNVCVPVPEQVAVGAVGCVVISGAVFTITVTSNLVVLSQLFVVCDAK